MPSSPLIGIDRRFHVGAFPESIRLPSSISSRSGFQRFSTTAVASHALFCPLQARRCLHTRIVGGNEVLSDTTSEERRALIKYIPKQEEASPICGIEMRMLAWKGCLTW